MKKILTTLFVFTILSSAKAQEDFSKSWTDLYSYNHIVDFVQTDTEIIALTDNAFFIYNKLTGESEKLSSVNGLSGETTTSFYYDKNSGKIVIGYENGLVEIIDEDRTITVKPEIVNYNITGSKRINSIISTGSDLLLSLPFGILTLNLDTNSFGDTYFIGNNSSEIRVNEIEIRNNKIYAATENGVFIADLNNDFLVDSENWTPVFTNDFSNIAYFDKNIYVSSNNMLFKINNDNFLIPISTQLQDIRDITATDKNLVITTEENIHILDKNLSLVYQTQSNFEDTFTYKANTAQVYENSLYIGSENFGILKSDLTSIEDFVEIHPDGPISNKVYSMNILGKHVWIVYGGTGGSNAPLDVRMGANHFNGENWVTIPYATDAITAKNLVHVNIDPFHDNRVYISSFINGMVVIEDDVVIAHWNPTNTALESTIGSSESDVRVEESIFDDDGNLWIANVGTPNLIKKYSSTGEWTSYDLSSLLLNGWGMRSMLFDRSDNLWMGTRGSGAWAVSKDVNKIKAITSHALTGSLPHNNVRALALDSNNTLWIGTKEGLVTFNISASFFEQATYNAKPVVIASGEDDDFGIALLGTQTINTICVDGANNKWFGTQNGGVLYTNATGRETFLHFDKTNSPLPSNKILDIKFDEETGKVYFATDRGVVAYDSNIAAYGTQLVDAYAYPNPVKKQHEFVTIDGRNGNHLPEGTNVKILDAAGRLVYETNVVAGQEQFGGKVTWNKTNLAGRKVASGIYVVLLTIPDASETAMTKIAIIN